MSDTPINWKTFQEKINAWKTQAGADISTAEDLSLAVMNLVSLEEHFFFTGVKTKKPEYFDTALAVRDMRKGLLEKLMPEHEGETWCASKHLLAAAMRLMEVGNKLQSDGEKKEAQKMFEQAYAVYSIFWALKLKLVGVSQVKKSAGQSKTLEDLVGKLAECCNE